MRKSILLPLLLLACAGDHADAYYAVPDFAARAWPLTCSPVDLGDVAIDELRSATDTSFLVLDAAQRRLTEFGPELQPLWTLELHSFGPAGIQRPVSATLMGDSAVAVLSQGGLKLVILGRDGGLIHAEPLEFVPHHVAASDDELLVTAVPMGATPGALLFRFRNGSLEEVGVRPRPYNDMMVGALGNRSVVAVLPDRSALLIHQLLGPRAVHVSPARGTLSPVPMPVPDATTDRVTYVPRAPITQAQSDRMLVPAMAVAVDRARDEVYVLGRSGTALGDRWERAVLVTGPRLGFRRGYTLNVLATQMAVLPRRHALVVSDGLDRVFLCPVERADADAE